MRVDFKIDKEYKNRSGIYIIKNDISHKIYIGSAKDLQKRFFDHSYRLKSNKHKSPHLKNFTLKNPNSNFTFELLEICEEFFLLSREQYWMDFYKSYDNQYGFNCQSKAYSGFGYKHTIESKEKISKIHKGKKLTIDHIEKIKIANTGKSPMKGKTHSLETRNKISFSISITKKKLKTSISC